ncbi:glutamate receptor ionotropic, kainate 2-like [Macrobrachium nipponense]|uniref:glutamate receptor ionotropic, kainate 2-like n=1 Tax=Macrobrachium nipponense TaxID=159736 RepID=UPI0030C82199
MLLRRRRRRRRSQITNENKCGGKERSCDFFDRSSGFASSNPLRWMFLALLVLPGTMASDVIRIGGLFDMADDGQEAAFKYAVNSVNSDRTVLGHVRLAALVDNVPFGDSFRGARKICSLVRSGVAAILGPQSDQTSAHVQSMCDALQIPHIENLWISACRATPTPSISTLIIHLGQVLLLIVLLILKAGTN